MTAPDPDVCVVIPARDAAETIGLALEALDNQILDGDHEVIVVDDGSRDTTAAVAGARGARVVAHASARGSAAARNAGAAASRAPLLAFLDADCRPEPGWLAAGLAALRGTDLAQGVVLPVADAELGPLDRTLVVAGASGLFESANLFVRRDAFERAGGFPELLQGALPGLLPGLAEGHFGEDVLFGWRVRRSGLRTVVAESAIVRHEVTPRGPREFLRERRRLRYFPALVREIPELRSAFLHRGVFLSARSAAFDAALAGVLTAVAARRRMPLLAALPYLFHGSPWGDLGRPPRPAERLVLAAGDLIGLAALIQGSAAARTVVL
ncbi:MAG: hypothetical protein NVSMB25_03190 [Thermoleophilaceae bacterium]